MRERKSPEAEVRRRVGDAVEAEFWQGGRISFVVGLRRKGKKAE